MILTICINLSPCDLPSQWRLQSAQNKSNPSSLRRCTACAQLTHVNWTACLFVTGRDQIRAEQWLLDYIHHAPSYQQGHPRYAPLQTTVLYTQTTRVHIYSSYCSTVLQIQYTTEVVWLSARNSRVVLHHMIPHILQIDFSCTTGYLAFYR
jgi:hypothetical protein